MSESSLTRPARLQGGPPQQVVSRPASGAPTGNPALPPALAGQRRLIGGPGPLLCGYLSLPAQATAVGDARRGHPLLLVHSVNAAASAAEVRPIFEALGVSRPVLALELPGFGSSERGPQHYTPALMRDSILRALQHLRRSGLHRPADVLGVSLSAEFVTQAALAQPDAVRSVALVSPTGLESDDLERYELGRTKDKPLLRGLLQRGPWADPLYRLLTRESTMRKFLERAWGCKSIDEGLLAYKLLSAPQPGARFAPLDFVAGALSTRGAAHLYARLHQPVWLAHGTRGEFAKFDGIGRLGPPPRWRVDSFETGAMPYFERPGEFVQRYEVFLQRVGGQAWR